MDINAYREVAIVILEDSEGMFTMQLRDNIPNIQFPDCWGMFGGGIEDGETPHEAMLREAKEELDLSLNAEQVSFLRKFTHFPQRTVYVFHYPVTTDELDRAKLGEGQRFSSFSRAEIVQGEIECKEVASRHLEILNWYWNNSKS